jgi:hypothetical protein
LPYFHLISPPLRYLYGSDYLDNPTTDPPLTQSPSSDTGAWPAVQTTTVQDPPPPVVNPDVLGVVVGIAGTVEPVQATT